MMSALLIGFFITAFVYALHKIVDYFFLSKYRKTDAGLFSIWIETEAINDHQIKVVRKYSFHRWNYFILTVYKANGDYYNDYK